MDCNILLDIFEILKTFTKSGPQGPLLITKNSIKTQEKSYIISKHIIFTYFNRLEVRQFENFRKPGTPQLTIIFWWAQHNLQFSSVSNENEKQDGGISVNLD